ncbi:hypothetical protein LTR95_003797 [Oleoguttula sp. CCFEE 5521]
MFHSRKWYSWVIVVSGGMQTGAYVLRILAIQQPRNDSIYSTMFVLLMIAPVWTNAYAYMAFGRMVYNFTQDAKVLGIRAWRFTLLFVLLDVIAFLVQAGGASIASGDDVKNVLLGLHIYMAGCGFQQLCLLCFLGAIVRFHQHMRAQRRTQHRRKGVTLLYAQYAVVVLISIRIIFRLAEYSSGIDSGIAKKEAYQYVLDSTMMLIALVLLNVWHPGRLMSGPESNLPSRKERKAAKKSEVQILGRVPVVQSVRSVGSFDIRPPVISHTMSTPSTLLYNPHNTRTSPYYSYVAQQPPNSTLITFAGQIGIRPDGSVPSDPVEQIREAFLNLRKCLDAAGARTEDLMKFTYYIVNYDPSSPQHRGLVTEFLGDQRPATTLVSVPALALPGVIFEVDAIAAIPQLPPQEVDVAIIGAGLSGLQAAVDLQKAGLTVAVLEARDRVGGKCWSRDVGGQICDVGAAWINDSNQSRMFALAKRFNLELVPQNVQGRIVVDDGVGSFKAHPYGQLLSDGTDETAIADIIRVRDAFEAACQQIDLHATVNSGRRLRQDLDDITFEAWIRSYDCCQDAVNALTIGTRAMLGVEPSEMSALYFLDYCKSGGGYMQMRSDCKDGGQYLRIAQGTQSFSRGLASELAEGSLRLMSPVRRIEDTSSGVLVTTARGVVSAKRVVVSVPTPLYKEIQFSPPLPAEKTQLSRSLAS